MRGERRSRDSDAGANRPSVPGEVGRNLARLGLLLAVAAPMGAYLALVAGTRVDAPVLDDFDAFLAFAEGYSASPSWSEGLAVLLEPHVDHRIALPRGVALATLAILGRVDFALLSLLGNLCLVGLFLGLARGRRRDIYGLAALVPASLLVFQPQPVDVVHWPTASLATYGVLALAVVAFRLLENGTRSGLAAAWLCGLLALYTQGNGVALWPAAAGALWLDGRRREAWQWIALSVPPLLLYALTYGGHADAGGLLGASSRLPTTAHYLLNFLGAAPALESAEAAPVAAIALCAWGGWLVTTRREGADLGVTALGLFVVITAVGNAILRSGMGADYALGQSRYRFYSILLVVVCHLATTDRLRAHRGHRAYMVAAVAVAALFSAWSFTRYAPAVEDKASIAARSVLRWSLTGEGLPHPEPDRVGPLLSRSGFYAPDAERLSRFLDRRVERRAPSAGARQLAFDLGVVADDALVMIEGWMAVEGADVSRAAVFVVLDAPGERSVFSSRRVRGRSLQTWEPGPGRLAFRALILRSDLGEGPARIGLLGVDREIEAFVETAEVLR